MDLPTPSRGLAALAALLLVSGCAVQFENREPARELARASQPPGSVYAGWRVYQDRCARCHGPDGAGTNAAPDLLPRVRTMGPRRFVDVVLRRYDWGLPRPAGDAAREAQLDGVLQRREGVLAMPEWQGQLRVQAHIVDLYAYLGARAEGTQGPGEPSR